LALIEQFVLLEELAPGELKVLAVVEGSLEDAEQKAGEFDDALSPTRLLIAEVVETIG
jgi:hypothetical protein